jgi:hypothetical protein
MVCNLKVCCDLTSLRIHFKRNKRVTLKVPLLKLPSPISMFRCGDDYNIIAKGNLEKNNYHLQ